MPAEHRRSRAPVSAVRCPVATRVCGLFSGGIFLSFSAYQEAGVGRAVVKQPIDVAEEIVQRAEVREQRLVVETRRASARLVPDARKDLPEITPDIDVSGDD